MGCGEGSAVFKIDTPGHIYCLKTALYPRRTEKVLNEATIRTSFLERGLDFLPAPCFIDRKFFEYGAVVYDFIEGEQALIDDENVLLQLARYLAQIHSLDYQIHPDSGRQIIKYLDSLDCAINRIINKYPHLVNENIRKAFSKAKVEYAALISENLDSFPFGISANLHGDLNNNSIMDPRGKLWLIDWENSEYGDIVVELCDFIFDSSISETLRKRFFCEYQKGFPPSARLNFNHMGPFYVMLDPVFNICWGLSQLDANLCHNLEPERKLRDLAISARNWEKNFSHSASELIQRGITQLSEKLAAKNLKNLAEYCMKNF